MSVEIEINSSASAKYVGWSPAPCRIRQTGASADLNARLSSGGTQGGVVFYGSGATPAAASASMTITAPADGSWATFWMGGQFGRPSVADGDAAVSVEDTASPGTAVARVTLMVRIRKNANTLSAAERNRFVAALARLNNRGAGLFQTFRDMHVDAALREAHGRPGFLAWHRAYILDLERQLQRIDPSVALPYWRFDQAAPNLFVADFLGATPANRATVSFSATNPLQYWKTDGVAGIQRQPGFSTAAESAQVITEAQTLLLGSTFTGFTTMEGDPHGAAHTSFPIGWINDPGTAPKDPIFFLLHCNVDRLWAKWQWRNRLFDASSPDAFTTVRADRVGHRLPDTMWPWNGDIAAPRPSTAPGGGLAASPLVAAPGTQPTVASVFDYQGRVNPSAQLGFDYDDVPYP